MSTLTSLAKMSTSEAGRAVFSRNQAMASTATQTQKYEIKNEFKDLKLVLSDGTQLDAKIIGTVNSFNRSGNAKPV